MDYAKIIEALEAEGKTDMVEGIKARVQKVNLEAQNLRDRLKANEARLSQFKEAGFDVESDNISEQIEALKAKKSGHGEPDARVKALEQTIANINKTLAEKDTILKRKTVQSELRKVLEKYKAIDPDELTELLHNKVNIKDDQGLEININGTLTDLESGVSEYLKAKPHFVSVSQNGGSGAKGGKSDTQGSPKIDEVLNNPRIGLQHRQQNKG